MEVGRMRECVSRKDKGNSSDLRIHEGTFGLDALKGPWPLGICLLDTLEDFHPGLALSTVPPPLDLPFLPSEVPTPLGPMLGRVREA